MANQSWGPTVWLRVVLVYVFCGAVIYLILQSQRNDPLKVASLIPFGLAGGLGALSKLGTRRRK